MLGQNRIKVFDTTLRDGEQAPGVVLSPQTKIELARKFDEFGVDSIELMPVVSKNEMYVAKTLSHEGLNTELTALTRLIESDINTVLECDIPRVLLFTAVSDIQRTVKLGISREQNLTRAHEMVDYALSHGLKVDFGGEDAARLYLEDPKYLVHFIKELSDKIDYFYVPDTISCLLPHETYECIKYIKEDCRCKVILHNHNDLGLATANVLEGLRAGADGFSGTFTGIGERAGNTPIEEVCIALKVKGIELNVKYEMLNEICSSVARYFNIQLQPHKPIVGKNVFTHESGIHVSAMIKDLTTYQIINPRTVGRETVFLFGKKSGRAGLRYVLRDYRPSEEEINDLLGKIKEISESNKTSLSGLEVIELYRSLR
ncbi:MAG: LeuA family protein [Methanosarcinales archaeon]